MIVRLRHFPGHCTWGEARHEGGSWDGGLRACARDSSGLFLVLNLVSPCKVASGTAPDRVAWSGAGCTAVASCDGAGKRPNDQ